MQSETTAFFLLFGILRIYMRVTLKVQRLCNVIFFLQNHSTLPFTPRQPERLKSAQ